MAEWCHHVMSLLPQAVGLVVRTDDEAEVVLRLLETLLLVGPQGYLAPIIA